MAEELTFEQKMQQLEAIVSQLERGDVPLEAALTQFEKGVKLSADLKKTLDQAERTVAKVIDAQGNEIEFSRDSGEEND
ncbi:exodeoxyribonuclease VII small subunit [Ligilactobacillus saerimneri]|uniref:exodeoxyribonuclease VII small subunit n=1 Tax=Ligilactobacillus saerimneri TaxID=228229 RepID=UPI001D3B5B8C|nr:exodeoxyribonuclease VII small subunit [Ligilactobacillus saerimneri]